MSNERVTKVQIIDNAYCGGANIYEFFCSNGEHGTIQRGGEEWIWRVGNLFEIWNDVILSLGPMTPAEAMLAGELTAKFLECKAHHVASKKMTEALDATHATDKLTRAEKLIESCEENDYTENFDPDEAA